ncbi:MAG: alpha/beta hydrolase-fold protein [Planctomycetota bacterium]|nr:alpha/beta hydrolase-fold protein [Planctomycetota bacterium]
MRRCEVLGSLLLVVLLLAAPLAADEEKKPEPKAEPPAYKPKELGPSLRDQGTAALSGGKHSEAIRLYRAWLLADPKDDTTWYNLACALALTGKHDEALTAFETSVDAGFDDMDHAMRDGDLASVREHARFQAAVARGRKKAAADELPGMQRHTLRTQTIGTYIVLLPPDYATSKRRYPVVFILHGSGSSETGHGRVAEALGRDGVIYVAPRALFPHEGVFQQLGRPGWTAWPPMPIEEREGKPEPMRLYCDWILRCADDVAKRYRTAGKRVHVWGHSQGAGTASVLAALHPERVASTFAYAGYYPAEYVTDASLAACKKHGVHIELCHGTKDNVVPPEPTRAMKARLAKAGVSHAVHMVDAAHRLTEEVRNLSRAWVDAHARKAKRVSASGG